ncbi:glycine/D-amino acid oxidase-like deaminating enzyme [Nocardiopsis arvandica]|uniref:Glycine/D-amino acid oxidase-like deaminating enzyme n=1 Tax=Nocardiopsis sinuspersici TaxID=501010 RepID=A0A7Y9XEQ5_9ACTN|nr:FAD-dependent oxidoreductase [Nocardiopsis sinuspersici]NYH53442.1 glycine/D-amino acid oxidase-like deaminating enzyme [Nocardiopsis sinuspersici]
MADGATQRVARALADTRPRVFWLDPDIPGHDVPEPEPPLSGDVSTDLAVVGAGFSGLWTALIAKERDPDRDVVLVEARTTGWAASGRNGGFCAASLTHGYDNGAERWPEEIGELERQGRANLDGIEEAVARYGIDCGFERTGEILAATEPWQAEGFAGSAETTAALGHTSYVWDAERTRREIDSPTYVGALFEPDGVAMVHPAKLVWGLRAACRRLGVRVFENTPVRAIRSAAGGLRLETGGGALHASKVAWGTGAFPGPLRRLKHYLAPVYDYALMTEPLTDGQMASLGWKGRQGVSDAANFFHYYRLTSDNRILWGGYDIVHHYGGKVRPEFDQRPETFRRLAGHFFETFPQLSDVRFTHSWGGVIDTCSRFSAFFGTGYGGRLAYAAGYTGLGVGATRFGAQVMLDRLDGLDTERTRLRMVREKPLPFPPEPVRSLGIGLTLRATAAADRDGGRRNLWLRGLDAMGLGFDS